MPGLISSSSHETGSIKALPSTTNKQKSSAVEWSFTFRRGFESGSDSDSDTCEDPASNSLNKSCDCADDISKELKEVENDGDKKQGSKQQQLTEETADARLLRELDIASRADKDKVQYKANPWSIARINAASRPTQKNTDTASNGATSLMERHSISSSVITQAPVGTKERSPQTETNAGNRQRKLGINMLKTPKSKNGTIEGFFRASKLMEATKSAKCLVSPNINQNPPMKVAHKNSSNVQNPIVEQVSKCSTLSGYSSQTPDSCTLNNQASESHSHSSPNRSVQSFRLTDFELPNSGGTRLQQEELNELDQYHVLDNCSAISDSADIKEVEASKLQPLYSPQLVRIPHYQALESLEAAPPVRSTADKHDQKSGRQINTEAFKLKVESPSRYNFSPPRQHSDIVSCRAASEPPTYPLQERTCTALYNSSAEKDQYSTRSATSCLNDYGYQSLSSPLRLPSSNVASGRSALGLTPVQNYEIKRYKEYKKSIDAYNKNGPDGPNELHEGACLWNGDIHTGTSNLRYNDRALQYQTQERNFEVRTAKGDINAPIQPLTNSQPQKRSYQLSGPSKTKIHNGTVDPYNAILDDEDTSWSTLPARKRVRKDGRKANNPIKQSGKFLLPVKIMNAASDEASLETNKQSSDPKTSARRVVTYLPPPTYEVDSSDSIATQTPLRTATTDRLMMKPVSQWKIRRFAYSSDSSSDVRPKINWGSRPDLVSSNKCSKITDGLGSATSAGLAVPKDQDLVHDSGEVTAVDHEHGSEMAHADSTSKELKLDDTVLSHSNQSSDDSSMTTTHQFDSDPTYQESVEETGETNRTPTDSDESVLIDIATLEHVYPQTRTKILEHKSMKHGVWDELGLPSCGTIYTDTDFGQDTKMTQTKDTYISNGHSHHDTYVNSTSKQEIGIVVWGR